MSEVSKYFVVAPNAFGKRRELKDMKQRDLVITTKDVQARFHAGKTAGPPYELLIPAGTVGRLDYDYATKTEDGRRGITFVNADTANSALNNWSGNWFFEDEIEPYEGDDYV